MRRALARLGTLAFGLVIAAVGALVFSLSWDSSAIQQQLDAKGVIGSATIDARQSQPTKIVGKQTDATIRWQYFVSYSFPAEDGTKWSGEATVSELFFSRHPVGATTPVRYVPEDPRRSEVEFGHMTAKNYMGLFGGGAVALMGLGLASVAIFRPRALEK